MGLENKLALEKAIQLWHNFNDKEWDKAKELRSEDFEAYRPQSKEKIVGPDNFIELNRNYPGTHKIEVFNTQHSFDSWDHIDEVTTQVFIQSQTTEGKKVELFAISFFRIMEEKIIEVTEFWADTYPAPEWRKQYVERLD